VAQVAESGLFGVTVTVPYENPLLSPDWRTVLGLTGPGTSADVIVLRRNVEGGGRQQDMHHASHRELVGVSGAAFGHWNYDVYAQRGNVTTQSVLKSDFSITRGVRALDVVVDPRTGNVVCASALSGSDPNCVPYNIWTLGGVTPEALDYLQTPGFLMGSTSQTLYVATLSGDLGHYGIRFPGSAEGPEVVIGAERRSEAIDLAPDVALTSGDLAGSGGATPPVSGSYVVKELFGETRIPVTDDLRFTGSFRHSNYSTGKSSNTYGMGVDYSPVRHARIRGSYQRAIRAPDIFEAFSPQVLSGLGGQDPCAGENPGRSLAECARTGVTAAQYGHVPPPPEGIGTNLLLGGNPDLGPETGKTLTLGVVLEPMPDLSVSIDYYDIRVTQAIGTPPPNIILMQCADTGDPFYCALIRRDPVAGSLWLPGGTIDITLKNQDALTASGVDVALRHGTRLGGMGRISFEALGTYARKISFDIRGAGSYDCAGLFGPNCGRPLPRWRHRLLANWKMPWDVELAATWRYIGAVLNTRTDSNPLLATAVNDVDRRLSARNYLDLAFVWAVSMNFTLTAGVNNVLDRDPPLVSGVGAGFANGNTYPVVYDALGRRIFARLAARF
jgi:outer membrane receptor protein involved in Fe transport